MKVKKVLALVLASAMIMGSAVTTFAAETTNATITIENAEGAAIKYLQIVEPDPTSTLGWKYVDEYADNFEDVPISTLIEIGKAESGKENYYSTNDKINNSAGYTSSDLAETLEAFRETVTADENTNEVTNNTITGIRSGGLYVLVPEKIGYTYSPTLVYVPVNSTGTISGVDVKGSEDQIKKSIVDTSENGADGDESVTAGDEVQYTIEVEYPYIADNFKNPSFKITDTLTNATFKSIDSVKVGTPAADYTGYTLEKTDGTEADLDTEKNLTALVFDFIYNSQYAGQKIVITYTAEVGANVSAGDDPADPLRNKVESELKLTQGGTPIKTYYEVISHPVKATIDKVDAENINGDKLKGAVFALYEGTANVDPEDELVAIMADAVNTEGITLPDDYKGNEALLKADGTEDGSVVFDGLDANKQYYVVEVIAPAGYSVDKTPHQLLAGGKAEGYPKENDKREDASGNTVITTEYKYNDFTVNSDGNKITNTKLSSLPSTGGIGTTIFTIGGCVIMITAAGLYFASRRRQENK